MLKEIHLDMEEYYKVFVFLQADGGNSFQDLLKIRGVMSSSCMYEA